MENTTEKVFGSIDLTQFQLNSLSQLINARQRAQADEAEFVMMCLKTAGKEVGKDVPIKLENGKLTW